MNDFIKRCPFCGNMPEIEQEHLGEPSWLNRTTIKCENCGIYFSVNIAGEVGKKEVIDKWNTRYYESKLPIVLAEENSVDVEKAEGLGLRVLFYKKDTSCPTILK